VTPAQCRAARGLLDWSQLVLAKRANLAQSTVADFEREARKPIANNLAAMKAAFRKAGVRFIEGGVKIV
jgi:transcriptional regulator with XRE-family HTH domain